jgi:RND family efflux transporter MFP subunit
MSIPKLSVALSLTLVLAASSGTWGQAPPTAAKVETAPLDLKAPDRFQLPSILEPIRRVTLIAPADGIVRSQDSRVGDTVREGQEIAQLDRTEAAARLKIAQAVVKEQQAALQASKEGAKADKAVITQAEARLDGARARAELAQLDLDSYTLRAPFGGRLLASPVSDGQYVTKGTIIAELADISSLRALVPIARASVKAGGELSVMVEGLPVKGKVQAVIPLPEPFAVLHDLSTAFAAAWVVFPNTPGGLEPGQRVLSLALPTLPIANIPARALRQASGGEGTTTIQIIRNEYVTDVPVQVLGNPGPDRVQIAAALRHTDGLIVASSVPLLAGTLIRFSGTTPSGVEPTPPNPAEGGSLAGITPPGTAAAAPSRAPAATRPVPRAPAATKPAGKTTAIPF